MQTIFKYIAQFLLIPLLKEFGLYVVQKYKDHVEMKRLKKENKIKGENYEKAPADTAADEFSRLP